MYKDDYRFIVIGRQKALDKGFTTEDFTTWIIVVSQWLFSIGSKEVGYGGGNYGNDEGEEREEVGTYFTVSFGDHDPDDTLLGTIIVNQAAKVYDHPMRLENFDPITMRPMLAAWRSISTHHHEKMEKIGKMAQGLFRATGASPANM